MKKIKKLLPTSRVKEIGKIRILLTIQFIVLFLSSLGVMVANSYYISIERQNFCAHSTMEFPESSTDESYLWAFHFNFDYIFPKLEQTAEEDLYYLYRTFTFENPKEEVLRTGFFNELSSEISKL